MGIPAPPTLLFGPLDVCKDTGYVLAETSLQQPGRRSVGTHVPSERFLNLNKVTFRLQALGTATGS